MKKIIKVGVLENRDSLRTNNHKIALYIQRNHRRFLFSIEQSFPSKSKTVATDFNQSRKEIFRERKREREREIILDNFISRRQLSKFLLPDSDYREFYTPGDFLNLQ